MKHKRTIYYHLVNIIILLTTATVVSILLLDHKQTLAVTEINQLEKYYRKIDISRDLIYGNPEADLFIVEYGDLECPYCRDIHPNIKNIVEGPYGLSGRVAWVWRNGFHINDTSFEKAKVVACVKKHGGAEARTKSWKFIEESLYGGVLENEYPFDRYKTIIESLDLPFEAIDTCRKNNEEQEALQRSINDIIAINIDETPLLQFISGNGELLFEMRGALTEQQLELLIQNILATGIEI